MAVTYTRKQISQWLGSHTVSKALGYMHSVSNLRWEHHALCGSVQGTLYQPYEVQAAFNDDASWDEGECSCPVGFNCKHVAALLLVNLTHPAKQGNGLRPELGAWLDSFRKTYTAKSKKPAARTTHTLLYAVTEDNHKPWLYLFKARLDSRGTVQSIESIWANLDGALAKPLKFVPEEDLPILRKLRQGRSDPYTERFALQGSGGAEILEQLMGTERIVVMTGDWRERLYRKTLLDVCRFLHRGAARSGQVTWQARERARMQPTLHTQPEAGLICPTQPHWYIDAARGEAGTIDTPWDAQQLSDFLTLPPVSAEEVPLVAAVLGEIAPQLPMPTTEGMPQVDAIEAAAVPVLLLDTQPYRIYSTRWFQDLHDGLDFATVHFDYAGIRIAAGSHLSLARNAQDEMVHIKRQNDVESQRLQQLQKAGLKKIPTHQLYGMSDAVQGMLGLPDAEDWPQFVQETVPALCEKGWRVEMTGSFRFNMIEIEDIDGRLQQTEGGWFDLEMGVTVNDRRVRLEPLLVALFERDPRWLSGQLDKIPDDEAVELHTDRNERLHARAERLKPLVRPLIDLFGNPGSGDTIRVSEWDIGRLQALYDTGRWEFDGDASIQKLAQRLAAGPGVATATIPQGLHATLRPYQQQGLDWLQFLRANQLSGVLADDMGLGKTVQTLAHILAEKEAGRLDKPALIVMPTTLMHNWRKEAQRFSPALSILDLHGPQRHGRFDLIDAHDLILTTYALLWRDHAELVKRDYHLLILDEAQYVKNATTKAATTIRELRSRHRLCLTGTPLENHLGELWAQFDFLLPGFLGTQKDFTKRWRTPIEKDGDTVRRDLLAQRIRPFMLRRRKDEVAKELPPKTIIMRTVELDGTQRDLYESVRVAMQKKVRDAIAKQGFARSHIIVLEALLKLRQVCCDPRLVKSADASRVKESAKLEMLLEMIPALIDEGRRILLFSQFTGMLDLIAAALDGKKIPYVTLTGETTDRATPVKHFNQGKVPLFLISLRAGGVGLNLTAADTVIHYDPWWNPAVENQATDRAHRIGQDKPVFVYKLITADSIEEKIVAMQEKKAALADAVLAEDGAIASKFSANDIDALFEPTPATPKAMARAR